MSDKYIHHITLTTGHSRRSLRLEVDNGVMGSLQDLLSEAIAAGLDGVPIPNTDCTMTCAVHGRCLGIAVYGPPAAGMPVLVAYIGVAARTRCGAPLWRTMHQSFSAVPLATDPEVIPPAPWCGAVLHVGADLYPETVAWLGDFERCMAWAWLERASS